VDAAHRAGLDRPHRTDAPERDRGGNRDGLQFGPQILLLPLTGFVADHLDRRKVLFCTQAAMGLLALGLGLLVVSGLVQLWHVYFFAFLLDARGFRFAGAADLRRRTGRGALSSERRGLNSTSFNAAG